MGADSPEIEIGALDGALYVGLGGRATQRTCPTVDRLVNDYLATQPGAPRVVIDLLGCEWVDSTFAGWLLAMQKRFQRVPGARLELANCGERCRASLRKMQLGELFSLVDADPPEACRPIHCSTTDRPTKNDVQLMIAAHEALASVSADNARVFAPIVQILQQQLQRM
ncbi:MAG: STAS domain-containing protein [Phycisphaerae bacterium]|jgi:anti-anti-sigma regulatory factor